MRWLLAFLLAIAAWIGSWLFSLWFYLDVLNGGAAGDIAGSALLGSAVVGWGVFKAMKPKKDKSDD